MTDSSTVVRPTLDEKLSLATFNFTKRSIAEILRQRKVLPESSFRPLSSRPDGYFELEDHDDHSKELARALHHPTVRASIMNKSLKRLTVCVQAGADINTLVEAYQCLGCVSLTGSTCADDFTYSNESVSVVLKCGEDKIAEVEQSHLDAVAKSYKDCLARIRENASKVKNPGLNALLEAEVIPDIYLRYDIVKKRCILDNAVFRDDEEAKVCADIVQNASRSREIADFGGLTEASTKVLISIPRAICDPPKPVPVIADEGPVASSHMEDLDSVSMSSISNYDSLVQEGDSTINSVPSAAKMPPKKLGFTKKSVVLASNLITAAVLASNVPSQPSQPQHAAKQPISDARRPEGHSSDQKQGNRSKRLEPIRSSRPTSRFLDTSGSESVASNQTTGTVGLNHRIEEVEELEEVDTPNLSESSIEQGARSKHAGSAVEQDVLKSKKKAASKRPREDVPATKHAVENSRGSKRRKLKED